MKTFTTLLLGIICFATNAQDTTHFDTNWKQTTTSEAEYYRIQSKEVNFWTRSDYWSKNDQLQMKGNLSSIDPELKEGYYEWFHVNGEHKHKGSYIDGKEAGEHLWYSSKGKLQAIENWTQGVMNGKFEEYHANGNLSIRSSFVKGLQNGSTEYYREDATKHSEGKFLNGNRDGEWKYFGQSGELLGTNSFKTEYQIKEANLFLKLPNDEWKLDEQSDEGIIQYTFKRNEVVDPDGNKIVPAIMLYIEDASKFNGDVTMFTMQKQQQFIKAGVKVDRMLVQDQEDYPLTFKKGYFIKSTYSSNGLDHIFYMIHIITEDNKGIQLYLDMTTGIESEYESEFWTTIKSLRKL